MKRRLQIGVFGHHSMELPQDIIAAAEAVGRKIAELGHVLITGASTGVSYYAARGARAANGVTVGIIPGIFNESSTEHINTDHIDIVIASGFGYKGRNVLSVRSCNAAVFINGGSGTLNELLIAIDEMRGKCFILKNSGGISEITNNISTALNKDIKEKVLICDIDTLLQKIELL